MSYPAQTFRCPVCGYSGLKEPPRSTTGGASDEICPSCGFHFGYDDDARGETYASWRARWIARGRPWFSTSRPKPPDRNSAAREREGEA